MHPTSASAFTPVFPQKHFPQPSVNSRPRNEGTVASDDANASALEDCDASTEWSEEAVVLLHWRLLLEIRRLADPDTPLEEKYDTLRWVFTEREKDTQPFSFVSCIRVVGCSPLSPIGYCGSLDAEDLRDHIRRHLGTWMGDTLRRYPLWVREAIACNPAWVEANLTKNPQWINEQMKRMSAAGDLFA